jgi:hypothetical protein
MKENESKNDVYKTQQQRNADRNTYLMPHNKIANIFKAKAIRIGSLEHGHYLACQN